MINPVWFYLINFLDVLHSMFTSLSAIFAAFFICAIILRVIFFFEPEESDSCTVISLKTVNKGLKVFGLLAMGCILGSAFTPPKETGYLMLVAHYLDSETLKSSLQYIQNTASQLINF